MSKQRSLAVALLNVGLWSGAFCLLNVGMMLLSSKTFASTRYRRVPDLLRLLVKRPLERKAGF
jgi:hypothetical protein